jgi:dienelactone hydrolase
MMDGCNSAEHRERLAKHYQLEKPDGAAPFPAVMMVPGCSGFDRELLKKHYDAVQSKFVKLGFVTLRVDYPAARSADSCWPDVMTREVADDICIAAEFLRQQPFVKEGTINLIGWSYGGGGALHALGRSQNRNPVQVDAMVVYYPYCREVKQKLDSEIPLLVLVGAVDNVAPLGECKDIFPTAPSHEPVIRVYEDAHHSFDFEELPAEMEDEFGTIGYNEAAAKAAWL